MGLIMPAEASSGTPSERHRWRSGFRLLTRRRGWLGFAVGIAVGGTVGALLVALLPGLLAPDTGLEPGPLVIVSGKDVSDGHQREALINTWNQLHPANHVEIQELPDDADGQYSQMLADAQSGDESVDIYNLDVTSIAEFAHSGYLRPLRLPAARTGGFLRGPLGTCQYEGRLWALPFNTDAGLLFYRTDLGMPAPPTTWSAMVDDISKVLHDGPPDSDPRLKAGYTGQLDDYEGLTVNALEAIWAAGGDVVSPDGAVQIGSPQAINGLRRLANGLAPSTPQVILPDAATAKEADSTEAFRNHRVMFLRMWPVAYHQLQSNEKDSAAPPFAVSRLPGPSVLGGQDLAISSDSRHPRAAQALIEFLTSERSQQILFERGGFAATREIVYHDAPVIAKYEYAPVLLDAIQAARPRPVTPHYPRFSQVFRGLVTNALHNGGQLPANAASTLAAALRGY
jgi:multiple sugar transport system substrate-binding protein